MYRTLPMLMVALSWAILIIGVIADRDSLFALPFQIGYAAAAAWCAAFTGIIASHD